jgi:hypothetical protein
MDQADHSADAALRSQGQSVKSSLKSSGNPCASRASHGVSVSSLRYERILAQYI